MFLPPRNFTFGDDSESWNNLNIQRDPVKGIFTTYKNKRQERQVYEFEKDISRYDETIEKYTRGKDPFKKFQMNNTGSGKQAYKPIVNQILRVDKPTEYELLPLSRLPHSYYNYTTKKSLPQSVQLKKPLDKNSIQPILKTSVTNKKSLQSYGGIFQKLFSLPNFKLNQNVKDDAIHSKKNQSIVFDKLRLEKPSVSLANNLLHPIAPRVNSIMPLPSKNMKSVPEKSMIHDFVNSTPIPTNKSKSSTDKIKRGELPKNYIDQNSIKINSITHKNLKNEKPNRLYGDKDMIRETLIVPTNTNKTSLQDVVRSKNESIKLNENSNRSSFVTSKVFQNLSKLSPDSAKDYLKVSPIMIQSNTKKKSHPIIKNRKEGLEFKNLPKRTLHSSVSTTKTKKDGNERQQPHSVKLNPLRLNHVGIIPGQYIPTKDRDVNVPPSHLRRFKVKPQKSF